MKELKWFANLFSDRREQLGMSDYDIARLSGVSQPTIYRFLSGQNQNISAANLIRIAETLGFHVGVEFEESVSAEEYRARRANKKAEEIVRATQATSALEGQGLDKQALKNMKERIKQKLLAGPAKNLWAD